MVNFLRMFVRSSDEYKRFLEDPKGFGDKQLAPLAGDGDIENYLAEQLTARPVPPRPQPSDIEHQFLYRFMGGDQNRGAEEFVCESEQWVNRAQEGVVQQMLLHINDKLTKLASESADEEERICPVRNAHVIYRWIPKLGKLFLAGVAFNEDERKALEQTYAEVLGAEGNALTEELVLRNSMRTYPALMLADEKAWMEIQKDSEANLALSPEETKVLESVHENQGGFPIFINGRAGSGKSTILYYLFADYVSLYIELKGGGEDVRTPVMFSCSDELRRRAQETVTNLISSNPRWKSDDGGIAEVPAACFQEFKSFLYGLLTTEETRNSFRRDRYVDYSAFRRMWQEQFGKEKKKIREIGADLSWHVIRTYIKGTNSEEYLEPEDYEHLPRKQKSVSLEAFEFVYKYVWEAWYKDLCEKKNYWDDQDLARHLFDEDRIRPVYPVVFCDEAQDFTRIELDILFRLCLFSDRSLGFQDITRVPYAFAGDPFQTLNPTGFRWDAIQASFHDKLEDILGRNIYRTIDLNYQVLNLNYRSTRNIVRLCNLFQALRASLFDLPDLKPQRTWQTERSSPMPVWFDRDKTGDWEQLERETDVMIIVPCMLNEEQEYVEHDRELKRLVKRDESGVPLNVLSPIRAKGLEFARVVLYGFADKMPSELVGLLDKNDVAGDQLLPVEYFVNQLYVAASRPKRRLFIIETQQGRERLWKIANDEPLQQKIWRRMPREASEWKENIGGFIVGTVESWREDRGNPEENAERLMQLGLSSKDSFMLRSAAIAYENLNKIQKSHLCKGNALLFEGKYLEAGDLFQKAGDTESAMQCFWRSGLGAKENMQRLRSSSPDIGGRIECRVMVALEKTDLNQLIALIQELATQGTNDLEFRHRLSSESTFSEIICKYSGIILQGNPALEEVKPLANALDLLCSWGVDTGNWVLGELHFMLGNISQAVECWERDMEHATRMPNYRKAKSLLLADNFEKNPSITLSQNDAHILFEHFSGGAKFLLAAKCLAKTKNGEELCDLLKQIPRDHRDWKAILQETFDGLAVQNNWLLMLDIAQVSLGKNPKGKLAEISSQLRAHSDAIVNTMVAVCATKPAFAYQKENILREYLAFFSDNLLSSEKWRKELRVQAVGAAIEHGGRHNIAQRFYERVMNDDSFNRRERDFAVERLVATREKQSRRESLNGNEGASRRHASDALALRQKYGLGNRILPDFPLVSEVWVKEKRDGAQKNAPSPIAVEILDDDTVITEKPTTEEKKPIPSAKPNTEKTEEKTERKTETVAPLQIEPEIVVPRHENFDFEVGGVKFEFSRQSKRVNVTHVATMRTASILAELGKMQSLDVVIDIKDGVHRCDEWDIECSFRGGDGRTEVVVMIKRMMLNLGFVFED